MYFEIINVKLSITRTWDSFCFLSENLFQKGVLSLLILHRALWNESSMKSDKGVTCILKLYMPDRKHLKFQNKTGKMVVCFLYLSCSFHKQSNSCYSWFSSYPQHPIFRHLALRQRVIIFKMKISELLARKITGLIFVNFRWPRRKWCWLTWSSSPAWAAGTKPISPRRKSMTFSGLSKAQISNKGRYSMSVV